jgi:hypothetical protein
MTMPKDLQHEQASPSPVKQRMHLSLRLLTERMRTCARLCVALVCRQAVSSHPWSPMSSSRGCGMDFPNPRADGHGRANFGGIDVPSRISAAQRRVGSPVVASWTEPQGPSSRPSVWRGRRARSRRARMAQRNESTHAAAAQPWLRPGDGVPRASANSQAVAPGSR